MHFAVFVTVNSPLSGAGFGVQPDKCVYRAIQCCEFISTGVIKFGQIIGRYAGNRADFLFGFGKIAVDGDAAVSGNDRAVEIA